jgi:hypothetical protein
LTNKIKKFKNQKLIFRNLENLVNSDYEISEMDEKNDYYKEKLEELTEWEKESFENPNETYNLIST